MFLIDLARIHRLEPQYMGDLACFCHLAVRIRRKHRVRARISHSSSWHESVPFYDHDVLSSAFCRDV
jgi:hypothetical protein